MPQSDPMVEPVRGWKAVRKFLRELGPGLVRHFVWGELHEGGLDFRGLDRNVRALSWFGLAVLMTSILALIFADNLRSACDLILLSPDLARGQLAPTLLFPLTLFLFMVAWTFALCGALHAQFAIRWLAVGLYGLNTMGWINSILLAGRAQHIWEYYATVGSLLGVIAIFVWRGPAKPRPAAEFAALFALVSVVYLVAQHNGLTRMHQFGVPAQIAKMQFNLNCLDGLVTPLMILIGVDIAEFARRAAAWTTDLVRDHFPSYVLIVSLIGLLGWRWYVVGTELPEAIAHTSLREQLAGYGGALVELLGIVAVFAGVVRSRLANSPWSETELVETTLRFAFPLVILYQAVSLVIFLLLTATLASSEAASYESIGLYLLRAQHFLTEFVQLPWHYLVSVTTGIAALVMLRRGQQHTALYLGLFSVVATWDLLTASAGPLAFLEWRGPAASEFWWLVLLTLMVFDQLRRRQFTQTQQAHACFMLLVLTLFRQRDFIENPFTPLLGFAGAAFVAFGLVWDLATHGAWANHGSPALPRVSRLFMYLGYVILAGAVLNWAVATHDLAGIQKLTGGAALQGFDRYGKPLLYAIFLLRISGWMVPLKPEPTTAAESA